jgi:hypothetical protein
MRIREMFDEEPPKWMSYPISKPGGVFNRVYISRKNFSPVPVITLPLYGPKKPDPIYIKLRLDSITFYFSNNSFWVEVEFNPIENPNLGSIGTHIFYDETVRKQHFQIIAPIVESVMEQLEIAVDPGKDIYGVTSPQSFTARGPAPHDEYGNLGNYTAQFELGKGYHMMELFNKWNVNP